MDFGGRHCKNIRCLQLRPSVVVLDATLDQRNWPRAFQLGGFCVQDVQTVRSMVRSCHCSHDWTGLEHCTI